MEKLSLIHRLLQISPPGVHQEEAGRGLKEGRYLRAVVRELVTHPIHS